VWITLILLKLVVQCGKRLDGLWEMVIRKHITYHGRVQGVGFRYTAKRLANLLGLTGWVKNEYNGTVTMEVQGEESTIYRLMEGINRDTYIEIEWIDSKNISLVDESCFCVK